MKNFNIKKGNFLKSTNSTSNMMYSVLIILVFFIIFATYKNGIYPVIKGYGNLYLVFKPLLYASIASLVCLFTEYLYYLIKKEPKSLNYLFGDSYAIIPGVFLSLIISINTPIWLLILGSFLASLSKMLMGGLGKNKLNPALVGSLFVTLVFSSYINGYLNPYEIDTISSATPLSNMTASSYLVTYDNLVKPYGTLSNFFFGNIPGSIGETCSFLCIISFIYLAIRKLIKWRIPCAYVGTVTIISLIICLTKNIEPWFILFNILSGGLLFGAVFMTTDPVTSPISHYGQLIGGIILGILTMLIRYMTPLPEGVLVSILIFNILTIAINYLTVKLYDKKIVKIIILVITILLTIFSSIAISNHIITKPLDDTFNIISKTNKDNSTIYEVSGRGYAGNNSIKLKITFTDNNISNIEILKSSDTYIKMIKDNNYLTSIIEKQNDLESLNAVSGCTYSSTYIKEIVEKTKKDYYQK